MDTDERAVKDQLWNRGNVAPSDWVAIIEMQAHSQGVGKNASDLCDWLAGPGVAVTPQELSRLRQKSRSEDHLAPKEISALEGIISVCSARSAIIYFEALAYKGLKFFFPLGNPESNNPTSVPNGIYQGSRFSFSVPGMVTRSAFSFYYNERERELVSGYGVEGSTHSVGQNSNVLRFKEKRLIQPGRINEYQILAGGFVFTNRRCFYLAGAAFETRPGVDEATMKAEDIKHVHGVWYILDDDDNTDLLRGLKVTALRRRDDPAAAVVELEKVDELTTEHWRNIGERPEVQIGTFNIDPNSDLYKRLTPNVDQRFNMLTVNAYE